MFFFFKNFFGQDYFVILFFIPLLFIVSKDRDSNDSVSGSGLRFRNQSPSTTNRRSRDRERSMNDKTWERDADANTMLITNEATITSPAVAGNSVNATSMTTGSSGGEQNDHPMDDSRLSGMIFIFRYFLEQKKDFFSQIYIIFCFLQKSSAINHLSSMNLKVIHQQWNVDIIITIIIVRIVAKRWIVSTQKLHAHENQYEKSKRLVMKM